MPTWIKDEATWEKAKQKVIEEKDKPQSEATTL